MGATDGPNLALVVVGAVVGSTAYLAAVVTGAVACAGPGYMCERYGPLFIPLAGPFVALGTGVYDPARDDSPWPGMHVPIAIDGALQLAGVALLLAGLLMDGGPTGDVAARSPWRPSVRVGASTAQAQWTF